MKKFFLNKKLMTAVLSLCLCAVIGGIAVFAAFQSGLPGVEMLKDAFSPQSSENSSSEEESQIPEEEHDFDLDSDIVMKPADPDSETETEEPSSSEMPIGPGWQPPTETPTVSFPLRPPLMLLQKDISLTPP